MALWKGCNRDNLVVRVVSGPTRELILKQHCPANPLFELNFYGGVFALPPHQLKLSSGIAQSQANLKCACGKISTTCDWRKIAGYRIYIIYKWYNLSEEKQRKGTTKEGKKMYMWRKPSIFNKMVIVLVSRWWNCRCLTSFLNFPFVQFFLIFA